MSDTTDSDKTTRGAAASKRGRGEGSLKERRTRRKQGGINASETIDKITGKTREAFDEAGEKIEEVAESGKSAAADRLNRIAEAIDAAGDHLADEIPLIAQFIRDGADSLDEFAEDVRERSVGELASDARRFIRRHPGAVMGASALLSFAAARFLMASPSDEYDHGAEDDEDEDAFESNDNRSEKGDDQKRSASEVGGSTGTAADRQDAPADVKPAGTSRSLAADVTAGGERKTAGTAEKAQDTAPGGAVQTGSSGSAANASTAKPSSSAGTGPQGAAPKKSSELSTSGRESPTSGNAGSKNGNDAAKEGDASKNDDDKG